MMGRKTDSTGTLLNPVRIFGMQAAWGGRLFEHDAGEGLTGALIAKVAPCAGPTPGNAGPLSPLKDGLLSRASAKPPANLPPEPSAGCSSHLSSTGALPHSWYHAGRLRTWRVLLPQPSSLSGRAKDPSARHTGVQAGDARRADVRSSD